MIYKIGLIGVGFVSQLAHLPCLYYNKKVKILAICDKNEKILKKISKKYQVLKTYTSYEKMISNNKLDGIVLSVNRDATEKISEYILKKKINLLCEKPSALSSKKAKKLTSIARKGNTIYLTGYMKRHDLGVNKLKNNISKFNLGKLNNIYYEHSSGDSYANPFEYFRNKTKKQIKKLTLNKNFNHKYKNYLKFLNTHCHSINLIRYFLGDIYLKKNMLNQFGEGILVLSNKDTDILLNNSYSRSKQWIENLFFNYDNGKITLSLPPPFLKNQSAVFTINNYKQNYKTKFKNNISWSFKEQINFFISLMASNKKNLKYFSEDSIKDIELIEKIFKKY